MKYIKKLIIPLIILSMFFTGCESTELDLRDDPNNITPSQADPDLLLNAMQLSFRNVMGGTLNSNGMDFTRMTQLFGEYLSDPAFLNGTWESSYSSFLQDANVGIPLAENLNLNSHAGIMQILKAYILVTLVDNFGDVPYSEANLGTDVSNPSLDNGELIYQEAFLIIDNAIANLELESPSPTSDLYYGGNNSKWIKLANTLKLKMFIQTRLVNPTQSAQGITALINDDNLIDNASDDFVFQYSDVQEPTDTRHPSYVSNYNNGSGEYMSNNFMAFLKDNDDPRIRYYFYRQRTADPSSSSLPCNNENPPFQFCYLGDGYFGRDHGDNTFNTSLMFRQNTTWGIYPVGGKFDNNSGGVANSNNSNSGADGQGIRPFMLSSYVNFLKAEAKLTLSSIPGDAATYIENGIRQSITKTLSFGNLGDESDAGFRPSIGDVNTFVGNVMTNFNNGNNDQKLNIVMKQYLIALWGNGIEAYNNYRRTGLPNDLQSPQLPAGIFPRVNQYPAIAVELNSNISQHLVTTQVFWDTNASNFID